MAGTEARRDPGGHDPTAVDGTAQVEADHWRHLAAERDATLRALTRRPLVRLAVAIDRRVAAPARCAVAWQVRARTTAGRMAVALAGLGARRSRARRRSTVRRAAARVGPAPSGPSVSVITLASWEGDGLGEDAIGHRTQLLTADIAGPGSPAGGTRAAALARAAATATGDVLCFVPDQVGAPEPGWLSRLTAAIEGDVVAATPTLIHPARPGWAATEHDLLVRTAGLSIEVGSTGALTVVARGAAADPNSAAAPADVDAAPLRCLAVDRVAYVECGGLSPTEPDDVAAIDLCIRLRQRGGLIRHVPQALAYDDRPVASRSSLHHPIDPNGSAWRGVVERHGPSLVRAARPAGARPVTSWAITTAAPSARLAARWGDWHLAQDLARSLRRLGDQVVVQTLDQADSLGSRACDLHLVLHGLAPVRRTTGQRHVLWVISHPETLDLAECEAADLVLVASPRLADHLRARTSTPVEVLLQATDADRFRPHSPDPAHQHAVTVVAKTRDVMRPVVADAIAAGIRPAIYGGGWRSLVDAELVVTDHIDNALLPVVYSSAGVVLNDHWDTMRSWGFVSNRILDVLACGTPIISDDVEEIRDLLGDAVLTYRTSEELGDLVAGVLADPGKARARAAEGRAVVLAHHTFEHRAKELVDLVDRHGLRRPDNEGRP